MKGNFHVQFLGEGVAATSPPYPTPGWATTQVYPARGADPAEPSDIPLCPPSRDVNGSRCRPSNDVQDKTEHTTPSLARYSRAVAERTTHPGEKHASLQEALCEGFRADSAGIYIHVTKINILFLTASK